MTTEKRLAAIESELSYGEWIEDCDARWLIAKLRECNEACAKGKAIIQGMRVQTEYARGREDERAAVVAWIEKLHGNRSSWDWIMQRIERGEHLEGKDD